MLPGHNPPWKACKNNLLHQNWPITTLEFNMSHYVPCIVSQPDHGQNEGQMSERHRCRVYGSFPVAYPDIVERYDRHVSCTMVLKRSPPCASDKKGQEQQEAKLVPISLRSVTYGVVTGALESHDTRLLCQTAASVRCAGFVGGAGFAGCCGIMGPRGARSLSMGPDSPHRALPQARHR